MSEPARLRVALFGAGLVGQAGHAPTLWDERERFDFVAVADPSATVRTAIAERYGVPEPSPRSRRPWRSASTRS